MTEAEMRAFRVMFRASGRPRPDQVMAWDSTESAILAAAQPEPDDIDALVLEHAAWLGRLRGMCAAEGLTPGQLYACSLSDDFPSARARKLWLALGGLCCVPS